MARFIVLLRGINVGGKNILPMKELVPLLEGRGCTNVKTYIQSGNIVLESSLRVGQLSAEIEAVIGQERGLKVNVLVLSLLDLEGAVSGNPYPVSEGKLLHFFFLSKIPSSSLSENGANLGLPLLSSYKALTESFELRGRVLYLYAPDGIGRSKLAAKVEKALGVQATARNWNTVQKLVELSS